MRDVFAADPRAVVSERKEVMGNRSKKPKPRRKGKIVTRRTPAEHEAAYQARVERERASLALQRENIARYAAAKGAP